MCPAASAKQNKQRGCHTNNGKHTMKTTSEYDTQGFLSRFGLKFRATLSDSKAPAWADGERHGHHYRVTLSRPSDAEALYVEPVDGFPQPKRPHRLVFDFWGSIADAEKLQEAQEEMSTLEGMLALYRSRSGSAPGAIGKCEADWKVAAEKAHGAHPSAYSVLACISSDAYCPETFKDFCGDYGYETDSIKALQMFRRCSAFAKRLRAFFTAKELEALSEIQ